MSLVRMLTLLLLFISGPSAASDIPGMYLQVAEEQDVPAKLFYAIILNESRSTNKHINRVLPWPWTINHRGTPHFFHNRAAAYRFARQLVESGDYQFDVGLGQMNWRWHRHRFSDLWDALDPYMNLTASAAHLREQYERPECNSWDLAIGCYHRPAQKPLDKRIAANYRERVMKLWSNI